MSHSYPSDISRNSRWHRVGSLRRAVRVGPPSDQAPHRGLCQWRMLPADFPNWRTCYQYFRQWSERPGPGQDSILEP